MRHRDRYMQHAWKSRGEPSPARRVIEIANEYAVEYPGHHGHFHPVAAALGLAIQYGLDFADDDLKDFRGLATEDAYTRAVAWHHTSAARALETAMGRKPFPLAGRRLTVGSKFVWDEREAKVTSFADDGESLIACAYRWEVEAHPCVAGEASGEWKIDRRFTITRADLAAETARIKEGRIQKAKDDMEAEIRKTAECMGRQVVSVEVLPPAEGREDPRIRITLGGPKGGPLHKWSFNSVVNGHARSYHEVEVVEAETEAASDAALDATPTPSPVPGAHLLGLGIWSE